MKIIKNVSVISLVFCMFSAVAFSQFEIGLTLPVGLSKTFTSAEIKPVPSAPRGFDGAFTYDVGLLMQIGYNIQITEKIGISLLHDIGYYRHPFVVDEHRSLYSDSYIRQAIYFDTLNLGLLPKINIRNGAIGIGGGVKIPLSATSFIGGEKSKLYYTGSWGNEEGEYKYLDIKELFKYPIIPYIKLTLDGYYYFGEKTAFTIGAFIAYDFGMEYETAEFDKIIFFSGIINKFSYSSLSFGVQLGVRFGPKKYEL